MRTHGYGDSAITSDVEQEDADAKLRTLAIKKDLFEAAATRLATACLDRIYRTDEMCTQNFKQKFSDLLLAMYRGDEVEVSAARGGNHTLSFESAEVLPTLSALKWRTEQLIVAPERDWKGIACTAKAGYWLIDKYSEIAGRKAKLFLVVSDMAYQQDLVDTFGKDLMLRWLPWWQHNRNVTVFLDREKPVYAISFERRMRASIITPVLLEAPADVRHAWELFLAYWVKASRFPQEDRGRFTQDDPDDRITRKDIEDAERTLLSQMNEK